MHTPQPSILITEVSKLQALNP